MKKRILILSGLVAIILISLFSYNYYSIRTRNAVENMIKNKKMINVLVAGSNRFNRNRHSFFAIISINPLNSNIGITFIPPSFKISFGKAKSRFLKIEEVDFNDFDDIQESIFDDLHMDIPFYIELYSLDVSRIVDMLEGVKLFILDQMKNMENIKPGLNYFDGGKTVRYINSAEDNSIFIKYDRIQDVIYSLLNDKKWIEKFNNLDFISSIIKSIKTNLLPHEIMDIGKLVKKGGDVSSIILPGNFRNGFYESSEISYKIYEEEFLTRLIIDKKIEPQIKIKIFNGTDVPGLARKMRNSMIKKGLNVVEFGTSPYRKMKKSIIINRKLNLHAAGMVSEITGITGIYSIIDSTQLNNILIIIGEDTAR